jgi:hypothetical protein
MSITQGVLEELKGNFLQASDTLITVVKRKIKNVAVYDDIMGNVWFGNKSYGNDAFHLASSISVVISVRIRPLTSIVSSTPSRSSLYFLSM